MDLTKLKHLLNLYVFRAKPSGLIREEKDPRDFDLGILWFGSYTPKSTRKIIKTISIKNQSEKNNCQWQASTVQKEVDEGVVLSARSLSTYGQRQGMVTGNGFSSLSSGQKALQDWGIAEQQTVGGEAIDDWGAYTAINLANITEEAATHKTKSYWSAGSRDNILKAIDEGHILTTGIDWYTGYNQGGGFSAPWIITKELGWKVGGHAIVLIGYDLNYYGRKVYIFQNSYGSEWGDNGKFYIDMDFFDRVNYGTYANLDIPVEEAKAINLKGMMKNSLRDSKGGIWFVKGPYRQLITSLKGVITMVSAELGIETNDAKISKLKDITKEKNPDGTPMKPFFPVE